MGVVINPESELGKELAKWEKPYRFEPYPKMLYRAIQRPDGKVICGDPSDEAISRSCQRIVLSEGDEALAFGQGWCASPADALARFETQQQAVARAAAEVQFSASRMSEPAQREVAAAEASTHVHVVDVTGGKRPVGRPRIHTE